MTEALNYADSALRALITWFLFSLGLWKMSGKLSWKRRWAAWIPGLRYAALGHSISLTREGVSVAL